MATFDRKRYILYFHQKKIPLVFKNEPRRIGSAARDRRGCTYQVGKRTLTDIATLSHTHLEEVDERTDIFQDSFGGKVLRFYTSVPTFDSFDREWDSCELEFLFFDGEKIHLVDCHRGYHIGSITVYEELLSAGEVLKPWLERVGFPTDDIQWTT